MRIIAGAYRGRILRTVRDLSVRPATDRVKQTIFDMLANRMVLDGATVLDLFAGSGSLGIEALSRGAARATFVETNPAAADMLERNLQILGCEGQAEIVEMDAIAFLNARSGPYNLVFADPPYAFPGTADLPGRIFSPGLMAPDGYALIEHTTDLTFPETAGVHTGPRKKFGRTVVTFFQGTAHNA